ncbi:MAG: mechanosensitive ion channel family protein [Sulfurimonadaceae bacterium]
MKQIFFLLLFTIALYGSNFVDDFFTQQTVLEAKLQDQNLSSDALDEVLQEQEALFKVFVVEFIGKHDTMVQMPYRNEIFTLKRRLQANTQRGNSLAVKRDELKLATLAIRHNILSSMNQVVQATELEPFSEFDKKLQEIIVERHAKDPVIDLQQYDFIKDVVDPDPLTRSIQENLNEFIYTQDINSNISALLIIDASKVYKAGIASRYGILSTAIKISGTSLAQAVDPYLSYIYLSVAKLFYIIAILIFIYVIRKVLIFFMHRLLRLVSRAEEDIHYMTGQISRTFTLFIAVFTSELIFIIYSGFADVQWLITAYNITYVFLVSFFIYRLGNAIAVTKIDQLQKSQAVRNEVINLGLKMINALVATVAIIAILNFLNVNLTAVLSGLGIAGAAVAFAAKDTIANFFGSVSILLSDLFEQGDWIAIDDMEGTVVEIGLRATTIRTFDNALIAIPNFRLSENGIKNWSRRTMGRRIKMSIGVTYESDMEKIKKAIGEIKQMLLHHPDVANEKTTYAAGKRQTKLVSDADARGVKRLTMVYMDEFASSSINILVYCFSRSVVWSEWLGVKEDVMFKIADILKANDLEFAYPTMMIHQAEGQQDDLKTVTE